MQSSKMSSANKYESIHPMVYSSAESFNIADIYILVTVISVILNLAVLFLFEKLRAKVIFFDLFTTQHNHELLVPMVKKKNAFGSFFSLIFIAIAIVYAGLLSIDFKISNIYEIKSLISLTILEKKNDLTTADK